MNLPTTPTRSPRARSATRPRAVSVALARWVMLLVGVVLGFAGLGAADAAAAVTRVDGSGATDVAKSTGFIFCTPDTASAVVTIPAATADGDVMIASVSAQLAIDSAPSGWSPLLGSTANGTEKVYSKVWRTGDPMTATWTSDATGVLFCGQSTAIAVAIDVYTGNDLTEPLTVPGTSSVFASTGAVVAPSDMAYEAGSLRVSTVGAFRANATQTNSNWTGLTPGTARGVINNGANVHASTAWEAVGLGQTGTRAAGLTQSVDGAFAYTVVIRPRHAQKLGFTTQPIGGVAEGVALPTQPAVAVQYGDGVTATDNSSSVTLSKASGPAAGILTCTSGLTVAAVSGVADFSGCQITGTKAIGTYTIKAVSGATPTSTSKTDATSTTFQVIAGPGTKLTFTTQPGGAVERADLSTQPRVTVWDAYDNVSDTDTGDVQLSIATRPSPGTGVLGCTTNPKAAASGVAIFAGCKITGPVAAGTYTLQASRSGLTDGTSASFTITHGTATKLAFKTQPGDAQEGSNLAPQPAVVIQDQDGNPVTDATRTVAIAKAAGPAAVGCTSNSKSATAGVATYAGCKVTGDNGAGTYTLSATTPTGSPTLTSAISSSFEITPAAPSQLVFTTQPVGGVPEGVDLPTQPVVVVQDAYKNVVTADTGDVTLSLIGGSGAGILTCESNSKAVSSGVATFAGCQVKGLRAASTTYKLRAAKSGLTGADSSTFTITYGAPTSLRFSIQPVGGVAEEVNLSTQPVVVVTDAYDNVVGNDTSTVTLERDTGPVSGILECTGGLGKAATSGTSTFAGCKIKGLQAAGKYTLKATNGTLASATSAEFVINPGTPTNVVFSTQPVGNVPEATALPTQPVASIQDAYANTVTSSTATVVLSKDSGPASGALSCPTSTLSKAAVAGVATFVGCQITGTAAAGTYNLSGASIGLAPATSDFFTIVAGPPTKLVFTTQPVGGVPEGTDLPTQPGVSVEDVHSNVVPSATDDILLSIVSGPGAGILECSANPRAAVAGVASFSSCQIKGEAAAGVYKLVASGGGLPTVQSSSFTIIVGPANKLAFTTEPTGGVAPDTLLPAQPKVAIRDAFENLISNDTSTVTLSVAAGPGGSKSSCKANAVAAVSSVATFAGCRITGAPGIYTLKATYGALQAGISAPFTIVPGSLSLTAAPYAFSPVTLNGFDQVSTATLPLRIADTTGATSGWRLSVSASAWTGGTKGTIPNPQQMLAPPTATCDDGSGTCDLAAAGSVSWPIALSSTPAVVYRATSGSGMGAQSIAVPMKVPIPGNSPGYGAFSQEVTVTIAAGP